MNDYELIDSGEGRRLERFGKYILDRPDPEVLWKKSLPLSEWVKADAKFTRSWLNINRVPERWIINFAGLNFWLKLSPFKHTGLFPEQAWQWKYISDNLLQVQQRVKVLNLFAYTGAASLFAARAGAEVTHLDASKPAITWANENRDLNNMQDAPIRWIIDDALKFTAREIKRGAKYDALIMDPPVYGHGPSGIPWNFNKDFPELLQNCSQIISQNPLFVLVNAYAISTSPITLANTLQEYFGKLGGKTDYGELTLKETSSAGRLLSTGIWAKWSM